MTQRRSENDEAAGLTPGRFLSMLAPQNRQGVPNRIKHDIAYLYSETTTRKDAHPRRVLAHLRKDWTFASPRFAPRPLDQMAARIRRARILQPQESPERRGLRLWPRSIRRHGGISGGGG